MKTSIIKMTVTIVLFNVISISAMACTTCNTLLQQEIFNGNLVKYLVFLLIPFALIAIIAIIVYHLKSKNLNYRAHRSGPLISSGIVLGCGLGGFIDGILFHQILQWHDLFSAVNPPVTLLQKQVNVFWDGIFHSVTFITTVIGIVLLWSLFYTKGNIISNRIFFGAILTGFGIFNLLEGTLNHYILKIHNVRELTADPTLFNHVFSGFSIFLILTGWLLIKKKSSRLSTYAMTL